MDKITIILQDKATIEALAKDPEVQVKIKDAIVDSIGRRSLKLMNANAEICDAICTVSDAIKKEIINQYFNGNGWNKTLKDEYKAIVAKQSESEFRTLYNDIIQTQLDILKAKVQRVCDAGVKVWEKEINERIAKFDFDKAINDAVQAEVARRLGKR